MHVVNGYLTPSLLHETDPDFIHEIKDVFLLRCMSAIRLSSLPCYLHFISLKLKWFETINQNNNKKETLGEVYSSSDTAASNQQVKIERGITIYH